MAVTDAVLTRARYFRDRYQLFFSNWNQAKYAVGIAAVVASAVSATIPDGKQIYRIAFSTLAAIAAALVTFLRADDAANDYLAAAHILDVAVIRAEARPEQIDDAGLIKAIDDAGKTVHKRRTP